MDRRETVKRLEDNAAAIAAQFDAPAADLEKTYAPGKWAVRQVLAHIADCEAIAFWRFGRAVAEPGSTVDAFEQDDWAGALDYAARPVSLSRDLFLSARRLLIHLVKTLPDERLRGSCRHPEKGLLDGYTWAALAAAHCEHHLGQIAAARSGRPWTKAPAPPGSLYGAGPEAAGPRR